MGFNMKKFFLLFACLSCISSVVYAVPPALRALLSEAREGIRVMARRNTGSGRATPGYRPDPDAQRALPLTKPTTLPGRIVYTDREGEVGILLPPFKVHERVSSVEMVSGGVITHLKKKP
jgi:hypothetical protein